MFKYRYRMNFDMERRTMYISRRQNMDDKNTDYVNIRKPLPINYNSSNDDPCRNPFKSCNSLTTIDNLVNNQDNQYMLKRDSKVLVADRMSSLQTLPKTLQYPLVNTNINTNMMLNNIPINTRLNNVTTLGDNMMCNR